MYFYNFFRRKIQNLHLFLELIKYEDTVVARVFENFKGRNKQKHEENKSHHKNGRKKQAKKSEKDSTKPPEKTPEQKPEKPEQKPEKKPEQLPEKTEAGFSSYKAKLNFRENLFKKAIEETMAAKDAIEKTQKVEDVIRENLFKKVTIDESTADDKIYEHWMLKAKGSNSESTEGSEIKTRDLLFNTAVKERVKYSKNIRKLFIESSRKF